VEQSRPVLVGHTPRKGLYEKKRRIQNQSSRKRRQHRSGGYRSLKEAIAWAGGDPVRVRVTTVKVPKTDVRAVRRKLRLSQSQLPPSSASAGYSEELGARTNAADGPARVLLRSSPSPEAVEDALENSA